MPQVVQYEPTNWQHEDVVSSAGLNKMEERIATMADCILWVNQDDNGMLDKTYAEIANAAKRGKPVVIHGNPTISFLIAVFDDTLLFSDNLSSKKVYIAASENSYPVYRPGAD